MIDLNKRNSIFAEAIGNCGATFLRPDTTPLLCYRAAKKFVDEYERKEREEHEQRHEAQKRDKPKVGEIYRDIFGNRYIVLNIYETFASGAPLFTPFIVLARVDDKGVSFVDGLYTPTLEDFMNPTFEKI